MASSIGYTVHQTWLASILCAIWSYYWNEDKSMIGAQTLDMMIFRSSGETPCSAWRLTASAANYQAEHGIPTLEQQIIMSEVWASIILHWAPTVSGKSEAFLWDWPTWADPPSWNSESWWGTSVLYLLVASAQHLSKCPRWSTVKEAFVIHSSTNFFNFYL